VHRRDRELPEEAGPLTYFFLKEKVGKKNPSFLERKEAKEL
jgi:hypothetical protein